MRILCDECYTRDGTAVIAKLLGLYNPPVACEFLPDYLKNNPAVNPNDPARGHDENWGPIVGADKAQGDWVVITRDRGKGGRGLGAPLPEVLPACGVTGVWLAPWYSNANVFELVRAVLIVLPSIYSECPRAKPGTRFKIVRDGQSASLETWPSKNRK